MTNHNLPSAADAITSASGASAIRGSGDYDLCDIIPIEESPLFARTYDEAKEIMQKYGVVAYYPVQSTNRCELRLFHQHLAGMAGLMTRLKEKNPKGNRGQAKTVIALTTSTIPCSKMKVTNSCGNSFGPAAIQCT